MHTIETTEVKIAKHFRRKQLLGGVAEIYSEGPTITGTVVAVKEQKSASGTSWVITIADRLGRAA